MATRRQTRSGRLRPTRCRDCGSEALRPVPWPRRFGYWFQYGRGGPVVICSACGEHNGSSAYMAMGHDPAGGPAQQLLRKAVGVVKAVLGGRTRHPVPRFYATLGAAAVPPALVGAALLPRRRRVVLAGLPAAAMAGGFVWSLASAVNAQTRRSIGFQLDPRRTAAADLEAEIERIRGAAPSLSLLRPDHWDGDVGIGGCGWSWSHGEPERVTQVSVVADHGPPDHDRPPDDPRRIAIEISIEHLPLDADDLLERVADLEDSVRPEPADAPRGHDPAEFERWFAAVDARRRARAAELVGRWRDATVTIDGTPTGVRLLEGDGVAVATFDHDDRAVHIEAVGVPVDGLALARVTDVEPLLAVMRARRSAWSVTG